MGKILGLKNPMGARKKSAAEGGRKFLAFFLEQNQDFSGEIIFFFDLSGSEIFDISEFHGCKKKNWRPRRRPKNVGLFLLQNQDFSGENYFFDLSGSEIFDIYKSGGCTFQRKLKSHGRKIWRLFFWNFV